MVVVVVAQKAEEGGIKSEYSVSGEVCEML